MESVLSSADFIRRNVLRSLLLDFPCATLTTPIAPDLECSLCYRTARPPYCPPLPFLVGFICLILLRSLLLDFPWATPAGLFVLNVRSFRPHGPFSILPSCALSQSLAGFIRLIVLRSLLLDFPCATPAKPIAVDRFFLMFALSAAWPILYIALLCPFSESGRFHLSNLNSFARPRLTSSSIFRVLLRPRQLLWTVCFLMFTLHFSVCYSGHANCYGPFVF